MDTFSCQPLLDRLTHLVVKSGMLDHFRALDTPLEKIKYCLEGSAVYGPGIRICLRNEIMQLLTVLYDKCSEHGKSESEALEMKNKGSKAYLKKQDCEALKLFTDCLRLAPPNSTVVPLAYANRSAVLYQMNRYEECLQDIERAEKSGYPSAIYHKLLTRRCSCFLSLRDKEKLKSALENCKKHVLEVPLEAQEKFKKTVEGLEEKAMAGISGICISGYEDSIECPALFSDESPTVKYMSQAMEMKVSSEFGRHIIAKTNIKKGSVVFVEKPYAAILLPEYHYTNCHTCFSPTINPLPCCECRDAVFCSEKCKSVGQAFHQYECGILHILSAVGIAHLALRVVFMTGWKLYCHVRSEQLREKVAGVGEAGIYNGENLYDGYRAVYHLLPHYDKCPPEDQLQYCIASIMLATLVLDKTNFKKHNDEDKQKGSAPLDVANLAVAIMRHIAQLVSNAHAITQIKNAASGEESKIQQVIQARIASAIYPSASLMNHSCKPNIINSFYKDMLVIRTIEDVQVGTQISNCYGPHYCRQPREDRQESLKQQYLFKCRCEPCIDPEYLRREATWNGFYCEACKGVATWTGEDKSGYGVPEEEGVLLCLQCHRLARPSPYFIDVCTQVNALHEAAEEALQKGDITSAIGNLRKATARGLKVYLKENEYFVLLHDTLARILGEAGDYSSCCQELRKCLEVTEARYGSESIELGHELLKFSDALSLVSDTKKKHEELLEVRQRIDNIFSLNYGPDWKKYLGAEIKD